MKETKEQKARRVIDRKESLSLDTIMVLKIGPNDRYIVTISNPNQNEEDERILLSSDEKETDVVESCINENLEFERKSITNYMPSDYIEIYNEALRLGDYDICITMIQGIESYINQISEERNKVMQKANRK